MSKTYKTRPDWVKVKDHKFREERHYHEKGVCDLDFNQPRVFESRCFITVNYYGYNAGFYSRKGSHARWLKAQVAEFNGSSRAKLRKDCRELRKLSINDIYDYNMINPRPRNGALWDM